MLEWLVNRRKKKKRFKFHHFIADNLKPVWYFDRGAYVWMITADRSLRATPDQVGNWIVYDGLRMVSGYMKTPDEAKQFAMLYIADEIIAKYYKHLNGNDNK